MKQALKEMKAGNCTALITLNCGQSFTANVSDIRDDVAILTNVKNCTPLVIKLTIAIDQIAVVGMCFDNPPSFD